MPSRPLEDLKVHDLVDALYGFDGLAGDEEKDTPGEAVAAQIQGHGIDSWVSLRSKICWNEFRRGFLPPSAEGDVKDHHDRETDHASECRKVCSLMFMLGAALLGFGYQFFDDDIDHGSGGECKGIWEDRFRNHDQQCAKHAGDGFDES
jgi:hypothetical protein